MIKNVLLMRSQSWRYSRSVWLANHDTLPQLAQLALTGSGNAAVVLVFMPSLREDVPDLFWAGRSSSPSTARRWAARAT